MIVVLDTNVWLSELALHSAVGSALKFYLKQRPARLAVPEVIRLEVQHRLRADISEAITAVDTGNRRLLALFGSMKEIVLPSDQGIDGLISGVFTSLGVDILDVPFSFESARSSFLKTIEKSPPSDKSQQFKDGVLWADCLKLLELDEVLLATEDKAFYSNREYGKGLAPNLLVEARAKSHALHLVHSITDVLTKVKTEISIDKPWFASVVRQRAHTGAERLLSACEVEVSGDPSVQLELFITENPELLYFKHTIQIPCSDQTTNGRTNIRLVLAGDGTLRTQPPEVVDVRTGEETLSFTNEDGTDDQRRNLYMSGHAVLGHRTVMHTIRHRLD